MYIDLRKQIYIYIYNNQFHEFTSINRMGYIIKISIHSNKLNVLIIIKMQGGCEAAIYSNTGL